LHHAPKCYSLLVVMILTQNNWFNEKSLGLLKNDARSGGTG